LQPTPIKNTLTNVELLNSSAKIIKIPELNDSQILNNSNNSINNNMSNKENSIDKNKIRSFKCSFQQQLSADVSAAIKPDCKTPFKNCADACKRLLRYHVFYQPDLEQTKLDKFDKDFEVLSQYLIYKKEQLLRKFQYNILKLTMNSNSLAENIMLDKSFIESETICLKDDKESVEKGNLLDLPEPPSEWREKIRLSVEEELYKLNETKKRKSDEENNLNDTNLKIKKSSNSTEFGVSSNNTNIAESEDEESEASGEEDTNSMHEFNKYLNDMGDDLDISNQINQINNLSSSLYNNSNNYNSMMQINSDHQADNLQSSSHHADTFNQLFDDDWSTANTSHTDNQNKVITGQQQSNTNWVQEDVEAVESISSILDGEDPTSIVHQQSNLDHLSGLNQLTNEFEDSEVSPEDTGDMSYGQNNQLNMNSDCDQMESAINSILDILVPPNQAVPDESVNNQLSSNGFNFDNNLTSTSQVNFSQNNYLNSMPSMMPNRTNFNNDYGNNDSTLEDAVKSIL